MTDPLAYLRAAHARAEQTAQLIEPGGYEPQTWHTEPSRSNSWVWVYSKSRCLGDPPEAAAREDNQPVAIVRTGRNEHVHIALHDPAAVLRRIVAERKLLALRHPNEHYPDDCYDCRREPGWQYGTPADRPCATVRALAEGWGWEDGPGDG